MDEMDHLKQGLLEFAVTLADRDIPLVVAGGYGLYLKQQELMRREVRTVLPRDTWPHPRSTHDLDVFIRPEIVVDKDRFSGVRQCLVDLGYAVLEGFESWSFIKPSGPGRIKIDLLVGPLGEHENQVRQKGIRARPKGMNDPKLHARMCNDAIGVNKPGVKIEIRGILDNRARANAVISVPEAFTYAVMKLNAFRDRINDKEQEFGRHHALDLFRTVAMMTEKEYERAKCLRRENSGNDHVKRAITIVEADFSQDESPGIIKLREHPNFDAGASIPQFVGVLQEIFGRDQSDKET